MLATLILLFHLLVIGFNLFGLFAVPLGAWRNWNFVHAPVWRIVHVASLGVSALQAALGRVCFLTSWESVLSQEGSEPAPLIANWVDSVIYWDIPLWVFSLIYLAVFVYAVVMLWAVPLRR